MKAVTMQLSEISESREVMESKPYPVVVYFTYLLMGILTIALIWMYFGEIDIVLKGTGLIRPEASISAVTNKVVGRVDEVFLEEGKTVKLGHVLYTIEHDDMKATEALLQEEILKKEAELTNLTKYRDSILSGKNLFDAGSAEENPYYYKYLGFAGDRGASSATVTKLQKEIAGMQQVKSSILAENSTFMDANDPYAMKYKEFALKDEELKTTEDDAQKQYQTKETLYQQGVIPKREFDDIRIAYEKAQNARAQYRNGFLSSVDGILKDSDLQLRKLLAEGSGTKTPSGMLSLETQAIVSTDDQIKTVTTSLGSLKEQLAKTHFEIEKCTIRAEIDGTVNVKQKITAGDYLSAGALIANVIPKQTDTYKVQISMPEKEISNVRVGDSVKLQVHALPHQEYGDLMGKVTKLSTDSVLDEKQGINFFVIEAEVQNEPLYSYKGKAAALKVGMSCDARVITKSKRILSFFLEKLELWD